MGIENAFKRLIAVSEINEQPYRRQDAVNCADLDASTEFIFAAKIAFMASSTSELHGMCGGRRVRDTPASPSFNSMTL